MQHYGAPTRLLDFTYLPYVALYFALRNRKECHSDNVEVWGISAAALMQRAYAVSREADDRVRNHQEGSSSEKGRKASFASEDTESSLQAAQRKRAREDKLIRDALNPCGVRRECYNHSGFVAIAQPPVQNARLASQQGVFLFNGAQDLTFEGSLGLMMNGVDNWYKRFQVPAARLVDIERHLFQFNIHDLSLFPDTEGLAGFVRQKLRLQLQ
jgi:hypothetical protein